MRKWIQAICQVKFADKVIKSCTLHVAYFTALKSGLIEYLVSYIYAIYISYVCVWYTICRIYPEIFIGKNDAKGNAFATSASRNTIQIFFVKSWRGDNFSVSRLRIVIFLHFFTVEH